MMRSALALAVALPLALAANSGLAAENGTAEEAKAMLERAVAAVNADEATLGPRPGPTGSRSGVSCAVELTAAVSALDEVSPRGATFGPGDGRVPRRVRPCPVGDGGDGGPGVPGRVADGGVLPGAVQRERVRLPRLTVLPCHPAADRTDQRRGRRPGGSSCNAPAAASACWRWPRCCRNKDCSPARSKNHTSRRGPSG